MARISLVEGDITTQNVDAIVNAANSSLMGGGGVDGAIHRAGGPEILAECKRIREDSYPGGLPTGMAVATTGGRLPARWVIHTVGPIYESDPDPAGALRSSYVESLTLAETIGATTVALPAISCGIYGYPLDEAASIAIDAAANAAPAIEEIRFVLFGNAAFAAFERALQEAH